MVFTPAPRVTPQLANALTPPSTFSGRPSKPRLTPVVDSTISPNVNVALDVAQIEQRVTAHAGLVGPAVVTHRQHGDVTGVEPEQPLELLGDLRLQRAARGETRELRSERVDVALDDLTGGSDPVGTGPQWVGHGGRQTSVSGITHPVLDGFE